MTELALHHRSVAPQAAFLWLTIAGIWDGRKEDFDKLSQTPDYYKPIMKYPLRSTQKIVKTAIGHTLGVEITVLLTYSVLEIFRCQVT